MELRMAQLTDPQWDRRVIEVQYETSRWLALELLQGHVDLPKVSQLLRSWLLVLYSFLSHG